MTTYSIHSTEDFNFTRLSAFIWFSIQRLGALTGVLLLSPLFLMVSILIRLESRGPALFIQKRVGMNGEIFEIYKFRTMRISSDPKYCEPSVDGSDREGICKKYKCDPRITVMGKFLRKTSIDELPQLFNVILGNMALVGPRPALINEVQEYNNYMLERLNAMPGITGLWQVSGRANTTFDEQIALDIQYVREQSMVLDIKLLFATIPAVLFAKGAY